jgi:hypothetical protein
MTRNARMAGAGAALLLAACGGAGEDARAFAVRDSAGVRIAESAAPAWAPDEAWRMGAEPLLDLGVADGDPAQQFERIVAALRLADGRIVVADAGAGTVRWFHASGRHLATAGRRGGGPGEFGGMDWVGAAGDSVLVWDQRAGRLTVFGPDARLARAVDPAPLKPGAEVVGRMGTGTLATPDLGSDGAAPGLGREPVAWLALTPDGSRARPLARHPGREMFVYPYGGLRNSISVAYGYGLHFAEAPRGYYAGDDARYEVVLYAPDGSPRRRVRRAHVPVPVTKAELDSAFREDRRVSGLPPGLAETMWQGMRSLRQALPRDRVFPAFGALRVDADENLWVEEYRRPVDAQPRWSVFDADGRWLGVVETRPGFAVHQVGADWILGVEHDEMDVPHVRMYPLRKPGIRKPPTP